MRTSQLTCRGAALGLLAALFAGGCGTPPPPTGTAHGRMRVESTTPGEVGTAELQPGAWVEFSETTAEQLIADLSRTPEFAESEYRLTIIFGDIVNKTNRVSTNEFEQFRNDLRGMLINSNRFSEKFVFRTNRAALERIREREMGVSQGEAASGITGLNPQYTYVLGGEMYLTERFDSAFYSLSFQLYRLDNGELHWQSAPYQSKQIVTRR